MNLALADSHAAFVPDAAVRQRDLVQALAAQLAAQTGADVSVIETHISYVLIAGETAYKIKKALRLPFVDYSTLAHRRECCAEELRLNRRLAPALYRDVVAITGSPDAPEVDGAGPVLDYAVRMRAFAQEMLLGALLARGELPPARIDELASIVARFHASLVPAEPESPFGEPPRVLADAMANFEAVAPLIGSERAGQLAALRAWTSAAGRRTESAMSARKRAGRVRECHGDLHLGNVALVDDQVTVFDGIEFNAGLRWIDVASEVAFLAMDLADRGRDDYAWRFLNGWLASSGDYGAVDVLRFYLVYRAMVRAKVRYLRAAQLADEAKRGAPRAEAERYLDLASRLAAPGHPALVVMHGLAGSGKSTLAAALAQALPAIRLRSDVERRRLHGLAPGAASGSGVGSGLYDAAATERTYAHLATLAARIVSAGYTALLDATFLARAERDRMHRLATVLHVPLVIVDMRTPVAVMRERVAARAAAGGDPSEATLAVLEQQLAAAEPLATDEWEHVVTAGEAPDVGAIAAAIARQTL